MAINETIVLHRAFRKLVDQINNKWLKLSFWTHASDVEFDDGKTAVDKMNDIDSEFKKMVEFPRGTLKAGETVLTITDERIKQNGRFEIFTPWVNPIEKPVVKNGSITLKFKKQKEDIDVEVRCF